MLGAVADGPREIGQLLVTRKEEITMPSDEAAKKKLLKELAVHFKVALVSLDCIAKQIATAIGIRLKAHSGLEIYQSSAVSLDNIPLSALRAILPPETSEGVWDYSEASKVQLLGDLLSRWNVNMKGVTRALQTASESVIRVVASLMAIKLTFMKVAGVDKLKMELMYVLADGTGAIHWPKDAERRMIEVSAGKETDIRAQISSDIQQMSTHPAKFPLSPEFWRNQLQDEMSARLAEARIHNCQQKCKRRRRRGSGRRRSASVPRSHSRSRRSWSRSGRSFL